MIRERERQKRGERERERALSPRDEALSLASSSMGPHITQRIYRLSVSTSKIVKILGRDAVHKSCACKRALTTYSPI
jgi:hypothetical protein